MKNILYIGLDVDDKAFHGAGICKKRTKWENNGVFMLSQFPSSASEAENFSTVINLILECPRKVDS